MSNTSTSTEVKLPDVTITIVNFNEGPFSVIALVKQGMRDAGYSGKRLNRLFNEYFKEASEGNYYHLLDVTKRWVNVKHITHLYLGRH